MVKRVEAPTGHVIQVGDRVACFASGSLVWRQPVTRVTPKRAYVRNNDVSESWGPRVYDTFGWRMGSYTSQTRNITYQVLVRAPEEPNP